MTVLIEQINAVWVKIACPYGLLQEINDHFSFEVPNAKFIKKKANMKNWDGKIRLLRKRTHLYLGLVPALIRFLKERGHECVISISKFYKDEIPDDAIHEYLKNLQLPHQLRDYQEKIIFDGIKEKRAVFLSATSSGKSICIYALTKFWMDFLEKPNILIIVPSINLVNQLESNFIEYSKNIGWDVKHDVSLVYHESERRLRMAPVTISTWQSAYQWSSEQLARYNMVIFDEVHVAKAKEISKFLEKLTNAKIRYGFTGTLDDEKVHHLVIEGLFGPKIDSINLNNLIEDGYATELEIIGMEVVHSKKIKFKDYQEEIEYLINDEKRNEFLVKLAKVVSGNTMILFSRIVHGKSLYELAKKMIPEKKIYLIYGDTEAELREKVRVLMNTDSSGNSLIIASIQIFSVGVDIPSLQNLILAHPTKSKIRLLQSIGRILRKHKEKTVSRFYDIGDNFRTARQYTWDHFLKRIHYYIKENLKYKTKRITL